MRAAHRRDAVHFMLACAGSLGLVNQHHLVDQNGLPSRTVAGGAAHGSGAARCCGIDGPRHSAGNRQVAICTVAQTTDRGLAFGNRRSTGENATVFVGHAGLTDGAGTTASTQSTSLSSPFLIPSVQDGAAQTPLAQLAEVQSAATLQSGVGRALHTGSAAVFVGFTAIENSVGAGRRDTEQTPAGQTRPDWQSVPFWHLACAPHLVEHEPPQSMSVSPPFWTLSVQLGVAQSVPPVH